MKFSNLFPKRWPFSLNKSPQTKRILSSNTTSNLCALIGIIISFCAVYYTREVVKETKEHNTINVSPDIIIPLFKVEGEIVRFEQLKNELFSDGTSSKFFSLYNIGMGSAINVTVSFLTPIHLKEYICNFLASKNIEFKIVSEEILIKLFDGKNEHEYKLMTSKTETGNIETGIRSYQNTFHSFNYEFPFILKEKSVDIKIPHELNAIINLIANLKSHFHDFDFDKVQRYPIEINISYSTSRGCVVNEIHNMFIVLMLDNYPEQNKYTSYFKTYKQQ